MRSTGKYLKGFLACASAVMMAAGLVMACATADAANPPPPTVLGVWNGSPGSIPSGVHPDVLNDYVYWGNTGIGGFLTQSATASAVPFVEIEPWQGGGTSDCQGGLMGAIAAGGASETGYEKALGSAVASFGHPVIFTFAHEMNIGGQYPWSAGNGCGVTPTEWKQAWNSVVANVRSTAAGNAFFMWAPNVDPNGSDTGAAQYWPGPSTVDMTGVDGYPSFCGCGGTFADIYGGTFTEIKALPGFSSLPTQKIFLAETSLAPLGSGQFQPIGGSTGFIHDMCADGGDGVLQFQEGSGNTLTSSQWSSLASSLATYCGGTPGPVPTLTSTSHTTVPTPPAPTGHVTPTTGPSGLPGAPGAPHVTGRFPAVVTWTAPAGAVLYYELATGGLDEQAQVPAALLYLSHGTHTLKVRACNQLGCGPYSPATMITD